HTERDLVLAGLDESANGESERRVAPFVIADMLPVHENLAPVIYSAKFQEQFAIEPLLVQIDGSTVPGVPTVFFKLWKCGLPGQRHRNFSLRCNGLNRRRPFWIKLEVPGAVQGPFQPLHRPLLQIIDLYYQRLLAWKRSLPYMLIHKTG